MSHARAGLAMILMLGLCGCGTVGGVVGAGVGAAGSAVIGVGDAVIGGVTDVAGGVVSGDEDADPEN